MTMTPPFDHHEKKQIILKGMQGTPIAALCDEYGITESQYIAWRDMIFAETFVAGPKKMNIFLNGY